MFCPKCGKQLPDDASFCPQCGAPVIRDDQPKSFSSPSQPQSFSSPEQPHAASLNGEAMPTEDYRNKPDFPKKLKKVNILSGIACACGAVSLACSIILRFAPGVTGGGIAALVSLMVIFAMADSTLLAIGPLKMGKKLFPDNKPKGFIENLPGLTMAFAILFLFGTFFVQGIYFIIYSI